MEWLNRMNSALELIETRMEAELDIHEIARAVCSSPFHFQRMFYMVTGVTVGEYVRKRKLTLAAQELASTEIKVIDVALKYGYDSPEAFAKAFRKIHGISPSAARASGMKLKAYPRLSFQISLKGDQEMDYRIVEKAAFPVVGKGIRVSTVDGENFRRIPKFWDECMEDGTYEALCGLSQGKEVFGICMEFCKDQHELTYMIAVQSDAAVPTGMEQREISAATWAVFPSVGPVPDAIQKVWQRIFAEWFPATGYEHADGPELEVYPISTMDEAEYRCEVWIPIVKQ